MLVMMMMIMIMMTIINYMNYLLGTMENSLDLILPLLQPLGHGYPA